MTTSYRHDPTRAATVTKDVLCTGWREPRKQRNGMNRDTIDCYSEREYSQARKECEAAMAFEASGDLHNISEEEDENFLAVIFEQCGPTAGEYNPEYQKGYYHRVQKVQREQAKQQQLFKEV